METQINMNKAIISLQQMDIYFSKQGFLGQAEITVPKSIKHGSINHYLYLFFGCLVNYGVKSSKLHQNLVNLYEYNPLVFNPSYIISNYEGNHIELSKLLRSTLHIRYPNESAKRWIALSKTLQDNYNNDPRLIFKENQTYCEYKNSVEKLKGFGQKTGGFLLRILIDNGMISPIDGITEIPIDTHDIDISIWTGVITGLTSEKIKQNRKFISQISNTWVKAANELSISPSYADQYLWLIGSELCSKKKCNECPISKLCARQECTK